MKQTLIACSMMEDEIKKIYEETCCRIPVIWMERGYHNEPEKLRGRLQELIDGLQDQDAILLAFGLCGNGTAGLVSKRASLVLPRFDDCINILLCRGKRKRRGLIETGSIYLTRGWTIDSDSILAQYEKHVDEYGREAADEIMEAMYRNYEKLKVIDTGCYDVAATQAYAQKAAELLGLSTETEQGSTKILKQLLTGPWDENFIVQKPGEPLDIQEWAFPQHMTSSRRKHSKRP